MASQNKELMSAFMKRDETQGYISNLEKLRGDGSVTEESYQAMKAEYNNRLTTTEKQIAEIKVQLSNELQLRRNDLMAYKTELEKLGTKFKVGELPIEKYRASDRKLRLKIQGIESDISQLETLISAKSSADIVELSPKREGPQLELTVPRVEWDWGRLLRRLGILICVVGTIVAVLFVPCQVLGTTVGWHPIWEDTGFGTRAYSFINTTTLILELVIINIVGAALIFLGFRLRPR
jgi:hypothetical protein